MDLELSKMINTFMKESLLMTKKMETGQKL